MSSRGYDGSIRIDTKIDEKGFNSGVRNMGDKVKSLGSSIIGLGANLITSFAVAAGAVAVIVHVISRFVSGLISGVNKVIQLGQNTQALKEDFNNLRLALRNAFLPLLEFALPLLQRVAVWLTKIFNFIGIGLMNNPMQEIYQNCLKERLLKPLNHWAAAFCLSRVCLTVQFTRFNVV